jgi:hypothetical protein
VKGETHATADIIPDSDGRCVPKPAGAFYSIPDMGGILRLESHFIFTAAADPLGAFKSFNL